MVIKKIFEDIKAKNIEEFGTDNSFNIYDEYEGELSLDRFPDRPDEYKKILDEAIDRKISI